MPKKLSIQELKNRFEKYGFIILSDSYKNAKEKLDVFDSQLNKRVRLSVQNMNYKIKTNQRSEFDFNNILNINDHPEHTPLSGFQRFLSKMNSKVLQDATEEEKMQMYRDYTNLCKQLAQKKPLTIQWRNGMKSKHRLFSFIEALKTIIKPDKLIRIKTIDEDHVESNYSLNHETLNYFLDLLNDVPKNEMSDSTNDLFDDHNNWTQIEIKFDVLTKRHGGFFPYLNKCSYSLDQFGIFSTLDYNNYIDNCFIYALQNSKQYTDEEMNLIRSCVNTRLVKVEDIQVISNLMKTHFVIRCIDENGETVLKQFKPVNVKAEKKITIILYQNHFMIFHPVNITEYYIKHNTELDAKYGSDEKRFLILNDEGKVGTGKMSLIKLLTLLHENNLLEPISIDEQLKIASTFKIDTECSSIIDELFRIKTVKDKNLNQTQGFSKKMKYDGYKLFGVHLNNEKLNIYYDKLQNIIDTLGIDLNVRAYTSYPALMEAIMYKYGCFDNVYELAGSLAKRIREKLVFPVPHTENDKPFYSNKRLYYIDLNGAYLSCVEYIPAGKCNNELVFTEQNTKIKDLIEHMYSLRKELQNKDEILAKMMKLLMTCCWGMSIRKEKLFKKHFPKNREDFIDKNIIYAVEYNNEYVKTISSISVHWSYPQFARAVLDAFEKKMKSVIDLVEHVYYYNVDALLIDEDGYKKVCDAGLIGNELGKFKIEHIFDEIAIMSKRKYVATLDDGTKFFHNGNRNTDYELFKQQVLSSPDTTVLI